MQSCQENSLKLFKQKSVTVQEWCTGLLPTRPPSSGSDMMVDNWSVCFPLEMGNTLHNQQENILLSLHRKSRTLACLKSLEIRNKKTKEKSLKKKSTLFQDQVLVFKKLLYQVSWWSSSPPLPARISTRLTTITVCTKNIPKHNCEQQIQPRLWLQATERGQSFHLKSLLCTIWCQSK